MMILRTLAVVLGLLVVSGGVALAQARHAVVGHHGLVYRRVAGRTLALDLYRPRDGAGPWPAVVLIHGGSWNSGDRWELTGAARDLAEHGFVAATIDYRLADEARFPAAVADARAAVRWLGANAGRFGVDPRRIGVFGPSAGGHLALMVATLAVAPGAARAVAACAAWAAPADLVRGMTDGDAVPRASLEVVERFLGGSFEARPERFALASPAGQVSASTPPLFLAHGDRDAVVPFSQAEYLVEAARRHGVPVTLVRVRDGGHELSERRADPPLTELWERTVAFFARHLGAQPQLANLFAGR